MRPTQRSTSAAVKVLRPTPSMDEWKANRAACLHQANTGAAGGRVRQCRSRPLPHTRGIRTSEPSGCGLAWMLRQETLRCQTEGIRWRWLGRWPSCRRCRHHSAGALGPSTPTPAYSHSAREMMMLLLRTSSWHESTLALYPPDSRRTRCDRPPPAACRPPSGCHPPARSLWSSQR